MTNYFRVGKIIATHGIKGEVKIFATTDDIRRFDDLKSVYLVDSDDTLTDRNNVLYIESVKYIKNSPIVKFRSFEKIEDSVKLIGKSLYIERVDAVPLKDNEYYVMDLIGLDAYYKEKLYGEVKDIMKTKSQDILVISHDNKDILVPMQSDFVDTVDINAKKIVLKTVEGLE